jgi:hypothetical protein
MTVGGQPSYVSPWSGSLRWLSYEPVKKELELSDEQIEQIEQLRKEITEEMRGRYQQMRDVPPAERQQKYAELNAELAERTEKRIKEVLLAEQTDRLQEISLQMRLRSYWSLGTQLASEDLADALGIDKRQQEKLQELQQEIRQEVQRKTREFYEKLNAEAQEKIFDALTERQRQKLEKMMGEKFELPMGGRQVAAPPPAK